MRIQDSAFAIILQDEQILLVKARAKENWQLPGGRLEPGETPADALIREVLEETGLDAVPRRLTGTYRREDGTVARIYETRAKGSLSGPRGEIVALRWVSIHDAKIMVSASTRKRIVEGLAKILAPAGHGRHTGS
ncbi:MAG TPA: NUDIX domain-containing protein [Planctomycetota bacterium]|nr:NUDIX domain-containing protein [Planctomycetota bacterium]